MKDYIVESYQELVYKVTWPTWKELQSSSILVLVASVIIALIVFMMDWVFGVNAVDAANAGWKGVLGYVYEILTN
jgi:preprotein translocase subunit SecE